MQRQTGRVNSHVNGVARGAIPMSGDRKTVGGIDVDAMMRKIEHDPDAVEFVAKLVDLLAAKSKSRRRRMQSD
jgi:hypothetical protein